MHGSSTTETRFMKVYGKIIEIPGETGGIKVVERNQEGSWDKNKLVEENKGGKFLKKIRLYLILKEDVWRMQISRIRNMKK